MSSTLQSYSPVIIPDKLFPAPSIQGSSHPDMCQQQSICVSPSCLCSAIAFTPCPTMFTPHVVQGQDAPHCTTKGTTVELWFCCHPNLDVISIQTRKIWCTSRICIVVLMSSALPSYKTLLELKVDSTLRILAKFWTYWKLFCYLNSSEKPAFL